MKGILTLGLPAVLLLGFVGGGLAFRPGTSPAISETSSSARTTEPTPTYVSELAPAVAVAPRRPASLPPTGGVDVRAAVPVTNIAGAALALAGMALIHAGLRARPSGTS